MDGKRGFTLVEVIVAVTILAGALVVIGSAWSGNLLRVRKAGLYNNVAFLLEKKMAEIDTLYKNAPLSEIKDEMKGDFGSEFKQYRWEFKSQEFVMPDLSAVLFSQEDGTNELMIMVLKQMTDFISKSIKEGTLSVFAKTARREMEYSVTTYFVDFNRQMAPGDVAPQEDVGEE